MMVSKKQLSWDHKDKSSKVKNETICTMSTSKYVYIQLSFSHGTQNTLPSSPPSPSPPRILIFPLLNINRSQTMRYPKSSLLQGQNALRSVSLSLPQETLSKIRQSHYSATEGTPKLLHNTVSQAT